MRKKKQQLNSRKKSFSRIKLEEMQHFIWRRSK